jgi:hypothetical protein
MTQVGQMRLLPATLTSWARGSGSLARNDGHVIWSQMARVGPRDCIASLAKTTSPDD